MAAQNSEKHTPLMTPGQLIIAFIFSNILFLILGIAIGKGDFTSPDPITSDQPVTIEITQDLTKPQAQPMDEFNSLEETSSNAIKEHINISPPIQNKAKDTLSPKTKTIPKPKVRKTATVKKPVDKIPIRTQPTPKDEGTYYLQLTASKSEKQAQSYLQTVKKKGYPALIIKEGAHYKVLIGAYSTRAKAKRMKSDVDQTLKIKSWIRTKP